MRLINAETLKLEEVADETTVQYAILSHRWEEEEVSFLDMQSGVEFASRLKGFDKIAKTCLQTLGDGYKYAWVDTCCINKDSSSELSEAINSMFRWYKASKICYAYLSDVGDVTKKESLEASKWFERGWTLQELIAPSIVVFYNKEWSFIGTKETLADFLFRRTGINIDVLQGAPFSDCSIAQRMSWASGRITTRAEDMAYSLLGIFDVNMPMLYGEGQKAFYRLQEEIIKQSDDHSIFAWSIEHPEQTGLLASSPAAFAKSGLVTSVASRKGRASYTMTNRGLSLKLMATPFTSDTYLVCLDCVDMRPLQFTTDQEGPYRIGMYLRRLREDDQYARVTFGGRTLLQYPVTAWESESWKVSRTIRPAQFIDVNVRQRLTEVDKLPMVIQERIYGFKISGDRLFERSSSGKEKYRVSASKWDPEGRVMSIKETAYGNIGFLDLSQQDKKIKVIKLGFDFDFNPVCFIATSGGVTEKTHILDRTGNINYGLPGQDAQWSREEQAEHPGIHSRSPLDLLAWSKIGIGNVAYELTNHAGLWALKGDRISGLHTKIGELAELHMKRVEYLGKMVWEVRLDNMQESSLRKMFNRG